MITKAKNVEPRQFRTRYIIRSGDVESRLLRRTSLTNLCPGASHEKERHISQCSVWSRELANGSSATCDKQRYKQETYENMLWIHLHPQPHNSPSRCPLLPYLPVARLQRNHHITTAFPRYMNKFIFLALYRFYAFIYIDSSAYISFGSISARSILESR